MMARVMVRRLCALAVLTVLVAAPPPLLAATCNVPRQVAAILANITGAGTEGLCGTTSPVGSLIGLVVLSAWVYLVLVAALRAFAVLGARVRIAGSTRLLVLTNRFLGGGWVRRLVDIAIGIGMVTASGSGHLIPPPGARPSSPPPTAEPAQQTSLAEHVTELLGLDDPAGPVTGPGDSQERLYVVQPGDTLALIAERELGDADLWAWLFELNQGRLMPDGQRLEWPDELRAGWVLVLPAADLVGAPPTSAPEGAGPTTTSPPSSAPAVPATTSPQRGGHPVVSVGLPSGSVVAFSLWLAMSTALLVALLRRRRSRMPSPPEPGICRYQPEAASVAEQLGARARAATQADESEATAVDGTSRETPAALLPVPPLEDLTSDDPARVPVGERDGETVDLDLAGLGALVLQGPDAVRVARAAVVTMLTQRGPLAAELLVVGDRRRRWRAKSSTTSPPTVEATRTIPCRRWSCSPTRFPCGAWSAGGAGGSGPAARDRFGGPGRRPPARGQDQAGCRWSGRTRHAGRPGREAVGGADVRAERARGRRPAQHARQIPCRQTGHP
jgi:LysM repeat protein